jgi:hypothetical protein
MIRTFMLPFPQKEHKLDTLLVLLAKETVKRNNGTKKVAFLITIVARGMKACLWCLR